MTGTNMSSVLSAYQKQTSVGAAAEVEKVNAVQETKQKKSEYGKTIGKPKLSEEGQKYYEQLKKKFGNYDFILVSKDQMENAKANAAKYANGFKTVVLIDEDKIERMATDSSFRKKYEDILSGAAAQLSQLKDSMNGANVKGYGMQVNDNGTLSYFAVLKKSSADQKARIEKGIEKKHADKKAAEKKAEHKAEKKKLDEKLKETGKKRLDKTDDSEEDEETVTISANSIEELLQKISDYNYVERSNSVQTEQEMMLGQSIDFRG